MKMDIKSVIFLAIGAYLDSIFMASILSILLKYHKQIWFEYKKFWNFSQNKSFITFI